MSAVAQPVASVHTANDASELYHWTTHTIAVVRKGGFRQTLHANEAVQEVAARRANLCSKWWFPAPHSNSAFPEGDGHIHMRSASDTTSRAMRRIGILDRKITTHSIRHFYATLLLAQGTPLHIVQKAMGHASLATTQLYIQVDEH